MAIANNYIYKWSQFRENNELMLCHDHQWSKLTKFITHQANLKICTFSLLTMQDTIVISTQHQITLTNCKSVIQISKALLRHNQWQIELSFKYPTLENEQPFYNKKDNTSLFITSKTLLTSPSCNSEKMMFFITSPLAIYLL